eukprot:180021_1
MGVAQSVLCTACIDSKPLQSSKCFIKNASLSSCDTSQTIDKLNMYSDDDESTLALDEETIEYVLAITTDFYLNSNIPSAIAIPSTIVLSGSCAVSPPTSHTIRHSDRRVSTIACSPNAKELKKNMQKLYSVQSNNSSPIPLPIRNIFRCETDSPWNDQDIDVITDEMSQELAHQLFNLSSKSPSNNDKNDPSLFRDTDREKWSRTRIDSEREAIKKQIYHLAMEEITSTA